MSSSLKAFWEHARRISPARRKYWELESSLGFHCGKFTPGIPKVFFDALRGHYKLTDETSTQYYDYNQDNIRTRIRLNTHGDDPRAKFPGKMTAEEMHVVEKKRIAHIDLTAFQRNDIGIRVNLRDEIPIDPTQPTYPKTLPATWKRKQVWTKFCGSGNGDSSSVVDSASASPSASSLYRIDMSIVTDTPDSVSFQVETEVNNIEQAFALSEDEFITGFMKISSELLQIISNFSPDKIKFLIVPVVFLKKMQNTTTRKRKRAITNINTLETPVEKHVRLSKDTTLSSVADTPSTLMTPSAIPVLPKVSLATMLASPSPIVITPSPLLVDTKHDTLNDIKKVSHNSDIAKMPSSHMSPSNATMQVSARSLMPPSHPVEFDELYCGVAVDWMLFSHSPNTFVRDDPYFEWL